MFRKTEVGGQIGGVEGVCVFIFQEGRWFRWVRRSGCCFFSFQEGRWLGQMGGVEGVHDLGCCLCTNITRGSQANGERVVHNTSRASGAE